MKPNRGAEGDDAFGHVHEDPSPQESFPPTSEQLVQQIKETADKLLRDRASRADLKLINTAFKELRYAFKVLAPYRNRRKVTVFGSARLSAENPAYKQAVLFGRKMAEADYMVITGAAQGIMEAGHVGAGRDHSIGVNILLPFEQSANSIIAGDAKLLHLKYFFTRKLLFVKETDAVALFAGGFGTQDEGWETLTLIQTGKSHLFPIVCVDEPGGGYWEHWQRFVTDVLLPRGLISASDLALYKITDSVDEAVRDIVGFYRVYHSLRYVKRELVLRLKQPVSADKLQRLRKEFADIVVSGTIEQSAALPEEAEDLAVADYSRLRFRFDRKNHGRLRQMVDVINEQ